MKDYRKKIKAAIFDVDGTLLDTMPVWNDIGERYLSSLGLKSRLETKEALHSVSLEQGAAYLKETYDLKQTIPEIIKDVLKIVADFYKYEAVLKPGVKETLEWLEEQGIKMAVATSGNKALTEAALERNGVADYFGKIFTCTEIGSGKDEPNIYLAAAEFLGSKPEETIIWEDALHAAQTAKTAGFVVLGVYDESGKDAVPEMKEICEEYFDRMDAWLAGHK